VCPFSSKSQSLGFSVATQIVAQYVGARPVESHSGAQGNILVGPPNIFMGPLWEENF